MGRTFQTRWSSGSLLLTSAPRKATSAAMVPILLLALSLILLLAHATFPSGPSSISSILTYRHSVFSLTTVISTCLPGVPGTLLMGRTLA